MKCGYCAKGVQRVNLGDDSKREERKSLLLLVMKGFFVSKFQIINIADPYVLIQNAVGQIWLEIWSFLNSKIAIWA